MNTHPAIHALALEVRSLSPDALQVRQHEKALEGEGFTTADVYAALIAYGKNHAYLGHVEKVSTHDTLRQWQPVKVTHRVGV